MTDSTITTGDNAMTHERLNPAYIIAQRARYDAVQYRTDATAFRTYAIADAVVRRCNYPRSTLIRNYGADGYYVQLVHQSGASAGWLRRIERE